MTSTAAKPAAPTPTPERSHMRDVLRGGGGAFVAKVAGAGLQLAFMMLVSRLFGALGAGVFGFALTTVTLVGLVARRGLDNAVVRFLASAKADGDWAQVRGVYRVATWQALWSSAVLAVALWFLARWIAFDVFDKPALFRSLRWMALGIVPLAMFRLHGEALRGIGWVVTSQFLQFCCVPLVALGVLLVVRGEQGIHAPAWSYVAGIGVAAVTGVALWVWATPQLRGVRAECDKVRLWASSRPLFWASLVPLLLPAVGTYVVGRFEAQREIGIYEVTFRTAGLTSFVLVAFNAILGPKFSALHGRGDRAALERTARSSVRFMVLVALPALVLFVGFPGPVLDLYGPRFADGRTALTIFAIGQFLNVATGPVGNLLMMTGHERDVRNHTLVALVVCLALNVWLTPTYGVNGAAVATATGLVLQNLLSLIRVRTRLGIHLWW